MGTHELNRCFPPGVGMLKWCPETDEVRRSLLDELSSFHFNFIHFGLLPIYLLGRGVQACRQIP